MASCNVKQCMDAIGEIVSHDDVTHQLIHVIVDNDGTYAHPRLRFASEYVAERLMDKFVLTERNDLLTFLRASEAIGVTAGLRGHLFEHWAHRTLSADGKFCMRDLRTGAERHLRLPVLRVDVFRGLSALVVRSGVYYRPWQRNLAAVNTITGGYLLQMTDWPHHPISAAGLAAALARLPPGAQAVLVFAVPEELYDRAQGFVGVDGRESRDNARLRRLSAIPQVAVLVPLVG